MGEKGIRAIFVLHQIKPKPDAVNAFLFLYFFLFISFHFLFFLILCVHCLVSGVDQRLEYAVASMQVGKRANMACYEQSAVSVTLFSSCALVPSHVPWKWEWLYLPPYSSVSFPFLPYSLLATSQVMFIVDEWGKTGVG